MPQNRDLVKSLQRDLDIGEAEAIALAVERKATVVFLDETDETYTDCIRPA